MLPLLGVDDPESPLHDLEPPVRRQRTFDALKQVFLREGLNQPLILLFEDLHWLDAETQDFLDTLVESVGALRGRSS